MSEETLLVNVAFPAVGAFPRQVPVHAANVTVVCRDRFVVLLLA